MARSYANSGGFELHRAVLEFKPNDANAVHLFVATPPLLKCGTYLLAPRVRSLLAESGDPVEQGF